MAEQLECHVGLQRCWLVSIIVSAIKQKNVGQKNKEEETISLFFCPTFFCLSGLGLARLLGSQCDRRIYARRPTSRTERSQ